MQDVGNPGNPPALGAGERGFKSHRPDSGSLWYDQYQPSFRPCIKTFVWLKSPTTIKISAIWASVYPSCCTAAVWNSSQGSQLFSAETTMAIISLIGFATLPPSMMALYCCQ